MWYSGWRGRGNWSSRNCPMFGKFSTPPCLCEIFPPLCMCAEQVFVPCVSSHCPSFSSPSCHCAALAFSAEEESGIFAQVDEVFFCTQPSFPSSLSLSRNSRIKWGVRKRKADEEGEESGKRRLSVAASLATAAAAESELGGRSRRN